MRLAKTAPHSDRVMNGINISVLEEGRIWMMRIMP